jgi:hypothetical protein
MQYRNYGGETVKHEYSLEVNDSAQEKHIILKDNYRMLI